MTKRLPPKRPEPWPAFKLLAAVLGALALVAVVSLDYISARKGERAYLFAAALKAPAPVVPEKPSGKPAGAAAEAPAPKPAVKPFDETVAASLAAAGVSEDSVLLLKGPKGRPLFEVELPAELYESVGPAVERALRAEGVRVLEKKRTPGEEKTEVLWELRRPAKEEAAISFVLPVEPPPVVVAEKEPMGKKAPRG
ncbi:MAG TPA: hypothetical protein VLJ16_04390, partial [Acidobacteriota bacterium]|nr:hypothetical protein [Acidobacteriota bacterium]